MSAQIIKRQRKALRYARESAERGDPICALAWLDRARKHYPVSKQQAGAVHRALIRPTKETQYDSIPPT